MKELSLKEIQEQELNLLIKFDKICKENNLKYSLAYGTLIGAVRHKGFIPWDDDVDVLMPRGDYEKMLLLKYEDADCVLRNYNITPEYYYSFAKLVDKTTYIDEPWRNGVKSGVFIDIFPMDFFDFNNDKEIKKMQRNAVKLQFFASLIPIKPFYYKRPHYVIRSLAKIVVYPFRNKLYYKLNNISHKSESGDYSSFVVHTEYINPIIYSSDIWNNLCKMDFEGKEFWAFAEYDLILSKEYGDYMTPPPKEYQRPVHGSKIYYK